MYYSRTAVAAVALAIMAPAHAQDDGIERAPRESWVAPSALFEVPEDATGTVFVRRQDYLVRLEDGIEKTYVGSRMKLLNPAALQLGNITLSWDPGTSKPILHTLKIYRDGQVIDLTQQAEFDVLRREDMLEQSMITGVLTAVYTIPDLRVGDELEYEVTTAGQPRTFVDDSYGLLMLLDQTPPGRFKLQLSWAEGEEPRTKVAPAFSEMVLRGDSAITIEADNPERLRPPKDAPPRYAWGRMVEYSDFASWAELSSKFAALYTEAAALPADSPLREETARIAAAYPTQMGRAKAALKLVQDQVRYVFVGLNAGKLSPASAEETWQRRYGDCKGKTALLLALLSELGVPAEAVMVNLTQGADDGLEQRLPSPLLFDHVLVRATIDGETYWLDGTLPSVATPSRKPRGEFRRVLPYREQGVGLETLPWEADSLPRKMTLYDIDASAGFEEPGRLTITNVTRGIEALQLYSVFSSVPRSQFEADISNGYASNGAMDEVESATWRFDEPTSAMIMTVSGTGPVDWDEDYAASYSLALPGGGFSPPSRRSRPSSQDRSAPYYSEPGYSCHVTTVTYPADTRSAEWAFNSQFSQSMFGETYTRRYEKRDKSISMVRGFRTERLEIPPDEAAADNKRIDDFDNEKAIIYHRPLTETDGTRVVVRLEYVEDDKLLPAGKTGNVPVASDPVWLGASPPCLAG